MGLRESFEIACPACGQDQEILILCDPTWTRVIGLEGDETDYEELGGHEWGGDNAAKCVRCGTRGTVRGFAAVPTTFSTGGQL
jgi:hypothetical protein